VFLSLLVQLDKIQGQPNKLLCILHNGFSSFQTGTGLKFNISDSAAVSSLRWQQKWQRLEELLAGAQTQAVWFSLALTSIKQLTSCLGKWLYL